MTSPTDNRTVMDVELPRKIDPVRCACGRVYDLFYVTKTIPWLAPARWTAPCCGLQADARALSGTYERVSLAADEADKLDEEGRKG